jgi:hypothetical protein
MNGPSMAEIAAAEKIELNRLNQAAKNYFYGRANWVGHGGSIGALLLALCAPVALLEFPAAGPALGAIAGAWIFVTRFGLERLRGEWQMKGVLAQEDFDCRVLGIKWNRSLAFPLPPEEIRGAAGQLEEETHDRPWYPSDGTDSWPISVLICQRANAVWAARQHRAFSYLLTALTIAWALFVIVLALLHGASLGEFLTTLLLPSLPGFLDATELASRHLRLANTRETINRELEALIRSGSATPLQIREIQDRLFALRRDGAPVPKIFYERIRADYDRDMHFGAAQMSAEAGTNGDN